MWKRRLLWGALKAVLLVIGWGFILFPNLHYARLQVSHVLHPEALIEPNHPAVVLLSHQVDREMPQWLSRSQELRWIETFIQRRLPYCHDWDQWDNVNYWPRASEAIAAGKENCNGIAIVTVSLLQHRGFKARIAGNPLHMWVVVDLPGEGSRGILGPQEDVAYVAGRGWRLPQLGTLVEGLRYGLVEFPLYRWALLVAWGVLVVRWRRWKRLGIGLATAIGCLGAWVVAAHWLEGTAFALVILLLLILAGFLDRRLGKGQLQREGQAR